jgi:NADH dehydrogenase
MKFAITGGTGFVGRNIARALVSDGHEVVLLARGHDSSDPSIHQLAKLRFHPVGLDDADKLTQVFAGCDAVAHCAGINRELGDQSFQRVHVEGTRNVVQAAQQAGVNKIILISFLRARPNCGSAYHESKWAAEEIVRNSGLDYTVFKCGVIYGRGDHMLDHLSHAFHTFPVFAFVGYKDRSIRPNAVEDVARIVKASLVDGALSHKTVAVLGPELLTLRQAVRRVSRVVGKRPLMFPMPVWFHYALAWCCERVMTVPLVSVAQVRMLREGLAEPFPPCTVLTSELAPRIRFSVEQIRNGLPASGRFGLKDIRCCNNRCRAAPILGQRASIPSIVL